MPVRHRRLYFMLCVETGTGTIHTLPVDVWHWIHTRPCLEAPRQDVYHSHQAYCDTRPTFCTQCNVYEDLLRAYVRIKRHFLQRLTAPLPRSQAPPSSFLRMTSYGTAWPFAERKWVDANTYVHPTGFELEIIIDDVTHRFWWPSCGQFDGFLQVFAQSYVAQILIVKMPHSMNDKMDGSLPRLISLAYHKEEKLLTVSTMQWPFQQSLGLHEVKLGSSPFLYGPIKSFIFQKHGQDVAYVDM